MSWYLCAGTVSVEVVAIVNKVGTMRDLPWLRSAIEDISPTGVAPVYLPTSLREVFHDFCTLHFLFLIGIGPSMSYKYAALASATGIPSLSDHPVIISAHSPKLQRTRRQQYYARLRFHDEG